MQQECCETLPVMRSGIFIPVHPNYDNGSLRTKENLRRRFGTGLFRAPTMNFFNNHLIKFMTNLTLISRAMVFCEYRHYSSGLNYELMSTEDLNGFRHI